MNQLVEKIVGGLTELTRDRAMFVHFDSIGILYLGGKEANLKLLIASFTNQIKQIKFNIFHHMREFINCSN